MTIYDRAPVIANRLMDRFKNPVQVTVQTQTRVSLGGGSYSETWANAATVNAAIVPASGSEQFKAKRLNVEISHTIYIKVADYAALNDKQRIVFDSRNFKIQYILNICEADAMFEAHCLEGAAT